MDLFDGFCSEDVLWCCLTVVLPVGILLRKTCKYLVVEHLPARYKGHAPTNQTA